jgi:hypothetical protein
MLGAAQSGIKTRKYNLARLLGAHTFIAALGVCKRYTADYF